MKNLGTFNLHDDGELENHVYYCRINDTLYSPPCRCWIVDKNPKGAHFSINVVMAADTFETGGMALDWHFIHNKNVFTPITNEFKKRAGIPINLPEEFFSKAREAYRQNGQVPVKAFGVDLPVA